MATQGKVGIRDLEEANPLHRGLFETLRRWAVGKDVIVRVHSTCCEEGGHPVARRVTEVISGRFSRMTYTECNCPFTGLQAGNISLRVGIEQFALYPAKMDVYVPGNIGMVWHHEDIEESDTPIHDPADYPRR